MIVRSLIILSATVTLLISQSSAAVSEARFEEQPLFIAETYGYFHYRIPGIIMTDQDTLVAWCEARKERGDWADIDIIVRRSTDGGKTWSKQYILVDGDDHGKTWQGGDIVVKDKTPYRYGNHLQSFVNPSETMAVELVDGSIMFNSRDESPENRRVVTVSPTGVSHFEKPRFDNALWDPVCLGSLIRFSKQPEDDRNRILFTNPNSIDRPRRFHTTGQRRENVTIRLSYDEGKSWPISKVLESEGSGYSDMAVGPDGSIYVLFEEGPGTSTQFLTLATFNLEWMTDGKDWLKQTAQ